MRVRVAYRYSTTCPNYLIPLRGLRIYTLYTDCQAFKLEVLFRSLRSRTSLAVPVMNALRRFVLRLLPIYLLRNPNLGLRVRNGWPQTVLGSPPKAPSKARGARLLLYSLPAPARAKNAAGAALHAYLG